MPLSWMAGPLPPGSSALFPGDVMVESTFNLDVLDLDAFATPGESRSDDSERSGSSGGCGSCGSGGSKGSACGNGLEKIYPTTAVRFGYMKYIGEFTHAPEMRFTCGSKVVIQTKRGIEVGEQVSLSCGGCDRSVTRDQMRSWVKACGDDSFIFEAGRILREATAADLAENAHILTSSRSHVRFCQEVADRLRLDLKVVDCECTFGGERIIFYFISESRVDFRSMVKDLATEFQTRIEMRQVGARDEARLLADYETCGREVCCKVFLKTLKPVSMKMAKMQKATLDPSKVSGRCGRLKCCLRYEHVSYEELERNLPPARARVRTNHGDGLVVNRQVLTQLVQIRCDDDTFKTVVLEDVYEINGVAVPGAVRVLPEEPAAPPPPPPRPRGRRGGGRDEGKPRGQSGEAKDRSKTRGPGSPKGTDAAQEVGAGAGSTPSDRPADSAGDGANERKPRRRRRGRRGGRRGPKPGGGTGSSGGAPNPGSG